MSVTVWSQLGAVANVVLLAAYVAIATSVLLPLARTGQLWANRLGLTTGLIFLSCGVGHAIHAEHTLHAVAKAGWGAAGIDWHLGLWDSVTAVIAVTYWRQRQRQASGAPADTGALFEDLQRRQKELEAEALEAELRAELALERERAARESFSLAFDRAPNGMALLDEADTVVRANSAFAELVGQRADSLPGVRLRDLFTAGEGPGDVRGDQDPGTAADARPVEVRINRPDGPTAWARLALTPLSGDGAKQLVQLDDITEQRRAQARLHHLALHDPLTGLPNRMLFHDRAATALQGALSSGAWTGCLFIDLDHFKVVNDSLGHSAGDEVLRTIADRLVAQLRPGDTVARMGGDEFCLLLPGLSGPDEASAIAERVVAALDGWVVLEGIQVTTGASIGVAVVRGGDEVTSHTLVRDADTALYRAKGNGRGQHALFDERLRSHAERRLRIEADLRLALQRDEISVVYQPQWSLSRGAMVGVEALVRWEHPVDGLIDPEDFVPIAAEAGLVADLGGRVLERAMDALASWRAIAPDVTLSVNVSARQLVRPGFAAMVGRLLVQHDVPAGSLCLELTETDLTTLGRAALSTLEELRGLGVRLAVDDVGTGQSSLSHLVTLPVDVIKIDQTFIEQVHLPGAQHAVVEALLTLARTIGIDVVAEGVETSDQVATLEAMGCDIVQGQIVGPPVAAGRIAALVPAA